MPFGGMLGSTFNFVFETQLEKLQDGDRFYYLERTAGPELPHRAGEQLVRQADHGEHRRHAPAGRRVLDAGLHPRGRSRRGSSPASALTARADPVGRSDPLDPAGHPRQPGNRRARHRTTCSTPATSTSCSAAPTATTSSSPAIGDDTLYGDGGNDRLEGGDGNDFDPRRRRRRHHHRHRRRRQPAGRRRQRRHPRRQRHQPDPRRLRQRLHRHRRGRATRPSAARATTSSSATTANEIVFGNEGDDWIEVGMADGSAGDNFDPLGLDPIIGNDVFIGDDDHRPHGRRRRRRHHGRQRRPGRPLHRRLRLRLGELQGRRRSASTVDLNLAPSTRRRCRRRARRSSRASNRSKACRDPRSATSCAATTPTRPTIAAVRRHTAACSPTSP